MFGYVQANPADLSPDEQERYHAAYCGLCHTLGTRHGFPSRMSLTYDLTFLVLLLSSLYEPEETTGECHCVVHPCRKHSYMMNVCTDYAADMTVALTYYKCLDDWNDNRNIPEKCYASLLQKQYEQVRTLWPEQCSAIETCLDELSAIEKSGASDPDAAANCFGRLMESVFLYRRDHWEPHLCALGRGIGRYIYLADAVLDLEQDRKHGTYNPLKNLNPSPLEFRNTLMMVLGEASGALEALPLVQDIHLLRNIMYSGIWMKYNRGTQRKEKVNA